MRLDCHLQPRRRVRDWWEVDKPSAGSDNIRNNPNLLPVQGALRVTEGSLTQ